MGDVVIRAEGIGKQYLLGAKEQPYRTMRDAVSSWARVPLRIFQSRQQRRQAAEAKTDSFWAVKDLSFEIERGDVVGLIGGNGAGKSTVLKILSRITEPTRGYAEIRGRVGSLLEVGTGFHPELTGRENVFLNGAVLGMKQQEIRRKFDELVAFAEVERFLDVPVKRYSSGMYMRLAFSVAAHLEPDVLLVDEVLAVGDATFRKKCLDKIKHITAAAQRTVVFVSHDMQAIQSLCSRAMHLERGVVVNSGDVRSVINRYLTTIASRESCHSWEVDPPGNHEVRLRFINVTSSQGADGVYPVSEDITVTMGFEAEIIQRGLCIGFDIVTPDGTTVLRSYQTDLAEGEYPVPVIGMNSWECRIPAGTLNVGDFYVCPKLSIHNLYWIVDGDPIVRFEMVAPSNGGRSFQSVGQHGRSGSIAPHLEWESCAVGM